MPQELPIRNSYSGPSILLISVRHNLDRQRAMDGQRQVTRSGRVLDHAAPPIIKAGFGRGSSTQYIKIEN